MKVAHEEMKKVLAGLMNHLRETIISATTTLNVEWEQGDPKPGTEEWKNSVGGHVLEAYTFIYLRSLPMELLLEVLATLPGANVVRIPRPPDPDDNGVKH